MSTPTAPPPITEDGSARVGLFGPDRWWNLSFGLIGALTLVLFTAWTLDYAMADAPRIILLLAILFGLFMAFNIGGNDVANSFGTSVGAGTLSMKQALLVAAVFEVTGAVLAGGEVTDTVRSGIVDLETIAGDPMDFVVIMMSALLGAAVWLLIATRMGWPVSTTHAIIGGIVGAAVTIGIVSGVGGLEMVQWSEIGRIVVSWFLSPALGGLVAYLLYGAILVYNEKVDERLAALREAREQHLAHRHRTAHERLDEIQQSADAGSPTPIHDEDPVPAELAAARTGDAAEPDPTLESLEQQAREVHAHRALIVFVPLFAAVGAVVITAMLLFKGLKNLHLQIGIEGNLLIMAMVGVAVWMAVFIAARALRDQELSRSTFLLFSWMQVFTASAFAFSHGSNDIANAIGPFAAVLDVLRSGSVREESAVPTAALLAFGIALIVGLWFVGKRVIATVGTGLTRMHPASGFAAELAAASVVMGASLLGLPVSSTHILIGAVLGIGLVNRSANWKLMRPIALAWVITIPAAAGIGAVCALALRALF